MNKAKLDFIEAVDSLIKANQTMKSALESVEFSLNSIEMLLVCMKSIYERSDIGAKSNNTVVIPPKPHRSKLN